MDANPQEEREGMLWFFGAGAAAIAVSVFLFCVDHNMTVSKYEAKHTEELRALRSAQAEIGSGKTDPRQDRAFPEPAQAEHSSESHHE